MKMTVCVERRHINASMTSGRNMIRIAMLERGYDDASIDRALDLLKPFAFDLFVDGDAYVVKIGEARNLEEADSSGLVEFDTGRIAEARAASSDTAQEKS